jgi:phage terminase large subunit-like protein
VPLTNTILIEDKADGPAVIDTLTKRIPGIIPFCPDAQTKYGYGISSEVEAGNVLLSSEAAWCEFIDNMAVAPNGEMDDCDCLAQALLWLQMRVPPMDQHVVEHEKLVADKL